MSLTLNEPIWIVLCSNLPLPSSVHQKLAESGWCCMQNYQLSTTIHIELEDNSSIRRFAHFFEKRFYNLQEGSLRNLPAQKI